MSTSTAARHFETLASFLGRPTRFVDSWWLPVGLGTITGMVLVFSIVFLQPMGTERYTGSHATLRYCGYGFCVLLAFLMVHGLSRWWVQRGDRVWRIGHEIVALALLVLLIFNNCYLWLSFAINRNPVTLADWIGFSTHVALPFLPLLVPPAVIARHALIKALGDRTGEERLVLTGRNQDDRLRLAPSEFLYAEAEQNYVMVHYLRRDEPCHRMVRATLVEIEAQLPGALRVHRSFLVNPVRVTAVEGNARKRSARIEGAGTAIPVSPKFELARLEAAGAPIRDEA